MFIYLRDGIRIEFPDAATVSLADDTVVILSRDGRRLATLRKSDLLAFSHRDVGEVWPDPNSRELQSPSK